MEVKPDLLWSSADLYSPTFFFFFFKYERVFLGFICDFKAWKVCERKYVPVTFPELLVWDSPLANPLTHLQDNLRRINEGTPDA